jgi:hypothetical protein
MTQPVTFEYRYSSVAVFQTSTAPLVSGRKSVQWYLSVIVMDSFGRLWGAPTPYELWHSEIDENGTIVSSSGRTHYTIALLDEFDALGGLFARREP